jgi:N4-gp56 family major capsid protein
MYYNDISPRTAAFAATQLLEKAKINNVAGRFSDSKTLPKRKSQTIVFRRFTKLDSTPVKLQEGVTPLGKPMAATDVTAYLYQYGDFIRISDVVEDTYEDPILTEADDVLGMQADEMIDKVRIGVFQAGSNKVLANGSLRTDVNTFPDRDGFRSVIRILKKQEAMPLTEVISAGVKVSTMPVPSSYFALCHSDCQPDLERVSGFLPVSQYAANMGVLPGEIGAIGELRFVFDNNIAPFADGGGAKGDMISTTGVNADVYPILVFAKHGTGLVSLAGKNAVSVLVSNPKAQAGDELAQKGSVGWKAWSGAVILNDAWHLRMEVAIKG